MASPLDIASRASNLSERLQIVEALRERNIYVSPGRALGPFDVWKINKVAEQLARQFLKEALYWKTPEKYTKEYLISALTTYKLFDLDLTNLAESEQSLYTEAHNAWLPTYRDALQHADQLPKKLLTAAWYEPEIYYGKFAKACEPFLVQLYQELFSACIKANTSLNRDLFNSQFIEDILNQFLKRFELALAWAIETDAKVYCAYYRIDKSYTTSDDYISYLNATFSDQRAYHRFYLRFPMLGRWLAQMTRFLADNGCTLIARLSNDIAEISEAFFSQKIVQIQALKTGKSDYHAGGQSVALVEVELANSQRGTFVYKPRCLQVEVAMQGVLERLARENVLNFATYHIIPKEDYGYAALIPSGRNHAESCEEVEHIYEELGGYLGLFHVLGGSDLHHENLLIADGHAFICDSETTLGVLPSGLYRPLDTVFGSVYQTGLLEWPRAPMAHAVAEMKISGYAGGESFQVPIALPRINDQRLSFELAVKEQVGFRVDPDAENRVYLDGKLVQPEDCQDSLLKGFNQVYEWFQQQPSETIQCISTLFQGTSIRFVNWNTQMYAQLLLSVRHPKCLMEPLEVDLVFNSLRENPRRWDQHGLMVERELASLWQLDIPIFSVDAQGKALVHDHKEVLPVILPVTPLEHAIQRIEYLSSENRLQQIQYIIASLSSSEVRSPAFVASAVDYAQQVGWQLCAQLRPPSEGAPWRSYQITSDGLSEIDIQTDLYNGTAGIALFLAYLDAITPQKEFRQAAERALEHAVSNCDPTLIGAFTGQGGLVYALTHLSHLWQQPALLELAVEMSDELALQVEEDRDFDVFSGVAGIIPIMLSLAQATSGHGLACAHRCAQHLLQHAERQENRLSWPLQRPEEGKANLTGFSHGTGGIGWALISLGCATQQEDYILAGRQCFAYEALHFDENEQDWHDLRTNGIAANQHGLHFANAWCNGSAGIGLSRIASWAMLGKNDDELLRESYQALAATLRNFHKLGNDTLCHGKAGNAELLLRFALLKDEPAFQMEANVQAQTQWRNFEKTRHWTFGGVSSDVFPGLMIGLAGLGMHFLRLAHPDKVPSALLLDAPQNNY